MEKNDKEYKIEITYLDNSTPSEIIEIKTKDIEWAMSQYQRNRLTFKWKIIK
jgi:hypothetical protein